MKVLEASDSMLSVSLVVVKILNLFLGSKVFCQNHGSLSFFSKPARSRGVHNVISRLHRISSGVYKPQFPQFYSLHFSCVEYYPPFGRVFIDKTRKARLSITVSYCNRRGHILARYIV